MKKIKLTQGKYTIVDDNDYKILMNFSWYYSESKNGNGYAKAYDKEFGNKNIYLHRFILNNPKGFQIDHINHDTLDNRKINLRLVNQSQSNMNKIETHNKFGYKGIYFYNHRKYYKKKTSLKTVTKNWIARIKIDKRAIRLGSFLTKEEAARAYNKAAIKYFGEYAYLNNI